MDSAIRKRDREIKKAESAKERNKERTKQRKKERMTVENKTQGR